MNPLVIQSIWAKAFLNLVESSIFYALSKSRWIVVRPCLGSLGWQLLMTSPHESNTIASQSALGICSRKWKTKLIIPIYFGTKMSRVLFQIISFSSLESELSLDSEDSKINLDWTHLTTVNSLLRALRAICNISSDDREDFFVDEMLVY